MAASVAWISIAPVKGMRMQDLTEAELGPEGVAGDREFFLVDEAAAMISATRIGPLLGIVPEYRPGTAMGRSRWSSRMAGGFFRHPAGGARGRHHLHRAVRSEAGARRILGSDFRTTGDTCAPADGPATGRPGSTGGVGPGDASWGRFDRAARGPVPAKMANPERSIQRRFRMNFGIDGTEPHEEDRGWTAGGDPVRRSRS
ncbi:MAG: MOSC N-terminal beta barrel domain-containing protein [Solirubrobacterales bacterium]|nr:MOSC N-terminal beta barrel domain-containing protein [Solirubrobacterales bacterium]